MFVLSYIPFYFATLEEYYTGALYLPTFNGVSDGSVLIIGVDIATGIMGELEICADFLRH